MWGVMTRVKIYLLIFLFLSSVCFAGQQQGVGAPASAGKATATYDTVNSGSASSNTLTVAIDPGNGNSNRIVVIGVTWEDTGDAATISSLTYDGNACTHIDTQTSNPTTYNASALYYYLNPSEDSKNVIVTMNEAVSGINMGVISLYNIKQQAPEATAKNTGSINAITNPITTLTDGAMIVDVVQNHVSTEDQTPDLSTERWEQADDNRGNGSTYIDEIHGLVNMDWTTGNSPTWCIVAAAFEAADL